MLNRRAAGETSVFERRLARAALLVSLAMVWLNLLLTTRWAGIAGSINGPKRPYFVIALLTASFLAWCPRGSTGLPRLVPAVTCAAGVSFLLLAFFRWFPPVTWKQVPFL